MAFVSGTLDIAGSGVYELFTANKPTIEILQMGSSLGSIVICDRFGNIPIPDGWIAYQPYNEPLYVSVTLGSGVTSDTIQYVYWTGEVCSAYGSTVISSSSEYQLLVAVTNPSTVSVNAYFAAGSSATGSTSFFVVDAPDSPAASFTQVPFSQGGWGASNFTGSIYVMAGSSQDVGDIISYAVYPNV